MPRRVVPIWRSPSFRSRAPSSATCHGMIRWALPETNTRPGRRQAAALEVVELADQHLGVDHAARADRARLPLDDPGGDGPDLVRLVLDDDRVARVGTTLITADEVGFRGEEVDDLALALVAPLRADDHGRRHGRSVSARSVAHAVGGAHGCAACRPRPGADAPSSRRVTELRRRARQRPRRPRPAARGDGRSARDGGAGAPEGDDREHDERGAGELHAAETLAEHEGGERDPDRDVDGEEDRRAAGADAAEAGVEGADRDDGADERGLDDGADARRGRATSNADPWIRAATAEQRQPGAGRASRRPRAAARRPRGAAQRGACRCRRRAPSRSARSDPREAERRGRRR